MEIYKDFKSIETGEMTVIRKGLFNPAFTISDGYSSYGKIIFNKTSKALPALETLNDCWTLKRESLFRNRTLHILNAVGETVGTMTNGDTHLKLNNGFEAYLAGSWFDMQHNKIADWKQSWYSYSKPYTITFDPSFVKTIKEIPLLALLGTYLIFQQYTRSVT